jgi:hypothetical protein
VSSPFLESTLLGACPGLRDAFAPLGHTASARRFATDEELLVAVRMHVVGLLAAGRAAEFARFARTMERLLAEADPVLDELLREGLLQPLARDVAEARVPPALVMPHLGPRATTAWRADP